MLLDDVASHGVLFIGGKGGVGKTSISSALAFGRMMQGQRVLLVSTDPAHNLGHLWQARLSDTPTRLAKAKDLISTASVPRSPEVAGGLVDAVEIDPATLVAKHFDAVYRQMLRMLPENMHAPAKRHLESARTAPGSHESAMLERVAECVQLARRDYDVVIFDTAPTGHTLHLLSLPEQLSVWTEELLKSRSRADHYSAVLGSIIGKRARDGERSTDRDAHLRRALIARQKKLGELRDVLQSGAAGFVVVTLAEPMPVLEALETIKELDDMDVTLRSVVVNRRSPADAGDFLAHRRDLETSHMALLRTKISRNIPIREVPLLAAPPEGINGIASLAQHL